MSAIQKITSYDEYALALIDLMLPDISGMETVSYTHLDVYKRQIQ